MSDYKLIPLTGKHGKGKFVKVDPDDYEKLACHRWYSQKLGYAQAYIEKKPVLMHRLINNTPENMYTDHISGDVLDNRKANLRSATHTQNMCNRRVTDSAASKYKGVSPRAAKGKTLWNVEVVIEGETIRLGRFSSEIEAARAYDAVILFLGQGFYRLNLPDEQTEPKHWDQVRKPIRKKVVMNKPKSLPYGEKGYGIHFCSTQGKHIARIGVGYKRKGLGAFSTREEAEKAVSLALSRPI